MPASSIYVLRSVSPQGIVDVYPVAAIGSATPSATLALPANFSPGSMVTDTLGQIYVGCQGPINDQVLVYSASATGNATPLRSVVVPFAPFHIAVDASGTLYVGAFTAAGMPTVYVYSATSSGSSGPLLSLTPAGIQLITAITTDTSGYLYVAGESPTDEGYILIYPPGASGTATPSRTIRSHFNFYGLTADSAGNVFATTDGPSSEQLVEFSPSASGYATPVNMFTLSFPVTQSSSVGSVTRDPAGNTYFAASAGNLGQYPSTVTIYTLAPGFSSTSTPLRTFSPSNSPTLTIAVH